MRNDEWRRFTRQLLSLPKTLESIQRHVETLAKASEAKQIEDALDVVVSKLEVPTAVTEYYESHKDERPRGIWGRLKFSLEVASLIALISYVLITGRTFNQIQRQTPAILDSASAALNTAQATAKQLEISQRPWIKIKHRIVNPLTFNIGGRASGKPVAQMTVEDTLENVGPTVAVNVFSWEDVVPIDPDNSLRTAKTRQREWCDASRHPNPTGASGWVLFPHDPSVQQSIVGPTMEKIMEAVQRDSGLDGKVGFVLVGCVVYKYSFEPQDRPTHQTRFTYYLGLVGKEGMFPYVLPQGVANQLRLIAFPDGFTAD